MTGANEGPVKGWIVWSAGPDGDYDLDWKLYDPTAENPALAYLNSVYDPTNGAVSNGDIVRRKTEVRIEKDGKRILLNQ